MRRSLLLVASLISFSLKAKSSEIPLKREFPIDINTDPCVDFYKYTCQKVMDSFQLREDRSIHTFSFTDSSERVLEAKKKYLSGVALAEPQSTREGMLKSYYQACMNESARTTEEQSFVQEIKSSVNGVTSRTELSEILAKNRVVGLPSIPSFYITSNQDRPLVNDVVLDTRWMTLPEKSFYTKPEVLAEFKKVLIEFFRSIGSEDPVAQAEVVLKFESGLANVYLTRSEYRDIMSVKTEIKRSQLTTQYPNLNLTTWLSKIPTKTRIRHIVPKAMAFVNDQMVSLPLADLKTIYVFNSLYKILDDGYPSFFQSRFNFEHKIFGGPKERPVRAERCTRATMGKFTPEIDSVLLPRLFPNFPTAKIIELSEKVRAALLESLKNNTWLSMTARQEAITKIKKAYLQLVAPQKIEEWDFRPVTTYEVSRPIKNDQLYTRLMTEKDLKELKGPVNPRRWGMGPLTINAYYNSAYNKFVLPVGILQYPFFDGASPMQVNLAAVGMVIGHELGHAIDDKGSMYDAKGILRSWMTTEDLKEFQKRTHSLVEQFNQIGHDGNLTLGENIGDLVGLSAAHSAAFGPVFKPENRELEKEFFTQFARVWCEVQRPKHMELRLKENPHALGWARVNEQVKHQPAFAKAFNCQVGHPMVLPPEQIVRLW